MAERTATPRAAYPHADALVSVAVGGGAGNAMPVPWIAEASLVNPCHRWALFIDQPTEGLAVIAGLAARVREAAAWPAAGDFSLPLVISSDERRLGTVQGLWVGAWPEGAWLMATLEGVKQNQWVRYEPGVSRHGHPLNIS